MIRGECGLRTPRRQKSHPDLRSTQGRAGRRSWLSLALAAVLVTGGVRELLDTRPRAVTLLTANQRVAAEGLGLADDTVGQDGARRADALARELVTQAATTVAGCGEHAQGCWTSLPPSEAPDYSCGSQARGTPTAALFHLALGPEPQAATLTGMSHPE